MIIKISIMQEEKEKIMRAKPDESSCEIIGCPAFLPCSFCPCEKFLSVEDFRNAINTGKIKVEGE